MWKRFLRENRGYIIALSITLGVMVLCVYAFFGSRAVEVARTQNMARADSLNAAIIALPSVATIVPAKTSGETSFVATSRSNLADQIESQYRSRSASWFYGLIPIYYAKGAQQAQHNALNAKAQVKLDKTAEHLTNLKKIIEYMPLVDLGTPFADDLGISERLNRTKQGINEAIEYIRWSGLPHQSDINTRLSTLSAKTLSLSDESKTQWASELLEVQKLILKDIESQDIQVTDIPVQLRDVAQAY